MDAHLSSLAGLALALDRGTDATFALLALVRQAQAQGLKVVFAAAADTPAHYEAALKKATGRGSGGRTPASPPPPPPPPPPIAWVPLISTTPGLWEGEEEGGRGGDGLARAEAAIAGAVAAAGPPEGVCLVLDSLTALRDAAPDPPAWRSFLASPALLASPAALVIARADAEAATVEGGEPARWLPALTAAASLILSAAPLPSGAAAGVDGTLTLERRAALGGGAPASHASRSPLAGAVFSFAALPAGGVRVEERRANGV